MNYRDLIIGRKTNCFCAFCKTPRRIPEEKHISFKSTALIGLFNLFLMFAVWGGFEAKVLILFACMIGLVEIGTQTKWRLAINCQHCGFDPVLYMKDPKKACEAVKAVIKEKQESPIGRLTLPNLPARVVKKSSDVSEVGRVLSKDV